MTGGMMFKGTPGPWKIVPKMGFQGTSGNSEVHDEESLMGILGADGSRVLWIGDCTTYYSTSGDEPNEHDASLIAAAPELLEALMGIISSIGEEGYIPSCGYTKTQKARAAIAKALGEKK